MTCVFMVTSLWSLGCDDGLSRDRRRLFCGLIAHRQEPNQNSVQIRAECALDRYGKQCTRGELLVSRW